MKQAIAIISILSLLGFTSKEVSYTADIKTSNVHWVGKKTTGQHEGDVKLQSGKLNFNNTEPASGEFVLDMNSITVTDIPDADDNKSLVDHLKDEDFFGVEKFPTATLTLKTLEKITAPKETEANYNATADLTIKGITNEIKFPARIDLAGDKVTATANITVDRTKWNIVYKSKTIFNTLGDKFIYDDITFTVKLMLNKAL